jgi:hypothetical protein
MAQPKSELKIVFGAMTLGKEGTYDHLIHQLVKLYPNQHNYRRRTSTSAQP